MTTLIWLIVWLIKKMPSVRVFSAWNNWGIALTICVIIDLIFALGSCAR